MMTEHVVQQKQTTKR